MTVLFFLFSSLALLSGVMVIQARNPVHSVLFLILVFFNFAGLLISLGLDFFAMIFLVVYVGAIAVLFLFVVMMLNVQLAEINEKKLRYLPVGGLLGLLFLFEIFLVVDNDLIPLLAGPTFVTQIFTRFLYFIYAWSSVFREWPLIINRVTNIEAVGQCLYTSYSYFFILAGLILLVAMIGAIVLTLHKGVQVKRQHVFSQNTREFSKTVIIHA